MGFVPFEGATPVNKAGAVPLQIVWFVPIEPTTSCGLIAIVMEFEVAGLPEAQTELEVSTHVITLPLTGI